MGSLFERNRSDAATTRRLAAASTLTIATILLNQSFITHAFHPCDRSELIIQMSGVKKLPIPASAFNRERRVVWRRRGRGHEEFKEIGCADRCPSSVAARNTEGKNKLPSAATLELARKCLRESDLPGMVSGFMRNAPKTFLCNARELAARC
jgi:hypothetical protein